MRKLWLFLAQFMFLTLHEVCDSAFPLFQGTPFMPASFLRTPSFELYTFLKMGVLSFSQVGNVRWMDMTELLYTSLHFQAMISIHIYLLTPSFMSVCLQFILTGHLGITQSKTKLNYFLLTLLPFLPDCLISTSYLKGEIYYSPIYEYLL